MKRIVYITLLIIILSSSCTGGTDRSVRSEGDTIQLKYAEHLKIVKYDGFTVVELLDPWNSGKTLHTYVLVPEDGTIPADLPDGTIVRTPLRRAVITTAVHCGLVISFNRGDNIKGVCDLGYINIPWIQQQFKDGKIANCGNGITPTLEKIVEINADAIMISPFQNSGGYGRLDEWGKPIIEAADYMETSALGRAEWMKFFGMLFGAEEEADSIFKEVESSYENLKNIAKSSKIRKTVLMDKISSSVWYVPGGNSTVGRIIADANADYPFSANENSGGVPLPFETVLEKAGNADVWMFRYNSPKADTYKSLLTENNGYSQFKSFKNKEVYGCNTHKNTFYEDTPFHPDLLLRDFIIITHPDITTLGKPKYFVKLNE